MGIEIDFHCLTTTGRFSMACTESISAWFENGILISTKYVQGRFRAKVLFIYTTGILCMSQILFPFKFCCFSIFVCRSFSFSRSLVPIHVESLCLIPYHSQTNGTGYFICLILNFDHIEFLDFAFNAHLHKFFHTQTHSFSWYWTLWKKNSTSHDKIPNQTSGAIESFQNLSIRLANAATAAMHKRTIEM